MENELLEFLKKEKITLEVIGRLWRILPSNLCLPGAPPDKTVKPGRIVPDWSVYREAVPGQAEQDTSFKGGVNNG